MSDIAQIVLDAPTYDELAELAKRLAARVTELEAALTDVDFGDSLSESLTDLATIPNLPGVWHNWLHRQANTIKEVMDNGQA